MHNRARESAMRQHLTLLVQEQAATAQQQFGEKAIKTDHYGIVLKNLNNLNYDNL